MDARHLSNSKQPKETFTQGLSNSFKAYGEAVSILFKHGLAGYLFIPGLVTLIYAGIYFFIAFKIASAFPTDPDAYPWWLSWAGSITEWVAKVIFWPAAIFVFLFSYKVITQVVLSPVLSKLSEEVEFRVFKGMKPETGWKEALSDIWRSLIINFRNLIREVLFCFAAGFIPFVGSFLALGISSYYTGFNFMDYTMERHRMNVSDAAKFVKANQGAAVGLGLPCLLGMMIPVVGWFVMPTFATVAATLVVYRKLKGV